MSFRYVLLLVAVLLCCAAALALDTGNVPSAATLTGQSSPGFSVHDTYAVGGDGGWDYLTVDSASHRLYISRSTRVTVLDTKKGAVIGEVANTPGVHGIAIAPKQGHGFTSNGQDNSVTVFDVKTLKETAHLPVGARPDAIIYDPASNRVFTMNAESQDATAIDAKSLKVVGTVPLGGRPEYAAVDEKGKLFVNMVESNELVAIDSKALTVKSRWSLAPGTHPSGLAIDAKNRRLFAVCGNEKMIVLDADTGRLVALPTIGKGPDAAAFDAKTGLAFSSNGRDGTVTVIKEVSPEQFDVIATVTTQAGARTMALDPDTHRLYLATARFVTPTTPAATTATPATTTTTTTEPTTLAAATAPATPPATPSATAPPGEMQRWHQQIEPNSFVILVIGADAPQRHPAAAGNHGMGRHRHGGGGW